MSKIAKMRIAMNKLVKNRTAMNKTAKMRTVTIHKIKTSPRQWLKILLTSLIRPLIIKKNKIQLKFKKKMKSQIKNGIHQPKLIENGKIDITSSSSKIRVKIITLARIQTSNSYGTLIRNPTLSRMKIYQISRIQRTHNDMLRQ